MYARSLHVYDFKCFQKATLRLQYPGRTGDGTSEISNVNLIVGDNGGGKSSILRAMAIAALAPALLSSGFVPYRLVRRAPPGAPTPDHSLLKLKAELSAVDLASTERIGDRIEMLAHLNVQRGTSLDRLHLESTPFSPIADLITDDTSPAFFVVGYGATRRVEVNDYSESTARRSRGLRYRRIAGLFEDQVALRPLQAWLPQLRAREPGRGAEIVKKINELLPEGVHMSGEFDEREGQYEFWLLDNPTPFSSLSDGYKAFIGWTGDLLGHLADVVPAELSVEDVGGIVLVDEIDLHIHPRWQRDIVPRLAAAFPRLQFVFTTHSPLVAGTVKRENIFVTGRDDMGGATVRQIDEFAYGQPVDDLLLSEYFGLTTTKPADFDRESEHLYREVASGNTSAALAVLDRLIGKRDLDGL